MSSPATCTPPLPVSWEECRSRGWSHIDVLLVTGDAYVDHPSFGIALIGRLLESRGYKTALLIQPRFDNAEDFRAYPTPKLFCGITAGNLDSIVANYTGNGKVREKDAYSEGGNPWHGKSHEKKERRRPDRATIIYTSLARSAFNNIPIVLGGVEASLRRFVHYDYKQAKLRASCLTDAKADVLVYGMGEKSIIEIAQRCAAKKPLQGIAGTCLRLTSKEMQEEYGTSNPASSRELLVLPSYEKIVADKRTFLDAEIEIDRHLRAYSARLILQKQQNHWVVQFPQPKPLSTEELDHFYALPFTRQPHPRSQDIPAHRMIADSVTIVRGCSGNCSFCAITRHQGPAITSRSEKSIVAECRRLSSMDNFSGTISDLGGPTANLYGTRCSIGSCKKRDCLYPEPCPHLEIDEELFLSLLSKVSSLENVSHLFISSGLRMELLLKSPKLMRRIIKQHTPGSIKIAPEHTDDEILELMHKESSGLLEKFVNKCREISKEIGKKRIELTPYIILSHPGSTPAHAKRLATDLKKLGLKARKFQDFTPTPGTLSTAMYVAGLRPDNKKKIVVPKNQSERMKERKILESHFHKPESKAKATRRKQK
ncbi:MAG: YgiQ family radical SAM protein [Desulfobulbaceae bacterium]|nr:YgiQ family radical SAM protein [Desulfobulbaceae bacterium]